MQKQTASMLLAYFKGEVLQGIFTDYLEEYEPTLLQWMKDKEEAIKQGIQQAKEPNYITPQQEALQNIANRVRQEMQCQFAMQCLDSLLQQKTYQVMGLLAFAETIKDMSDLELQWLNWNRPTGSSIRTRLKRFILEHIKDRHFSPWLFYEQSEAILGYRTVMSQICKLFGDYKHAEKWERYIPYDLRK